MFPDKPDGLVAWLAAFGVAALLIGPAAGQPASSGLRADPGDTQNALAPARLLPPGYNPGEMLRDLANPVLAEVDGHQITLAEVGDAIRALPANMRELPFPELYPGVLDRLVREQALVQKARRMRLDADPVVKRRMQAAAERVLENELLNRLLGEEISELALLARYQEQYAGKPGPEEVNVRVILVPTEQAARKLIADLAAGADFAELARKNSIDASASEGGSLGFLRQDKLVPEIGAAAFVMEPGQVSPNPMRGRRGWFVVKVDARRRVPQPGFAEVREQLRREMLQEGVSRVAADALAVATVRKFNMNGTAIDGAGEGKPERRSGTP
jgi:peptidyl-prolyl cis-trans isomerase C